MFKTDFSRIGELFYNEVGAKEYETCLKGFIRHAFTTYNDRYLTTRNTSMLKEIKYAGNENSVLCLSIIAPYGAPDLNAICIQGEAGDSTKLIDLVKGDITAEFSDLKLDDITHSLRAKIIQAREGNHAEADGIDYYFSPNQKYPNNIPAISLQGREMDVPAVMVQPSTRDIKDLNTLPITATIRERAILDDMLKGLFTRAEYLSITNSFYLHNDSNNDLLQESCEIKKPSTDSYSWGYTIKAIQNQGLPVEIFPKANIIFTFIQDSFDALSFRRAKFRDPSQPEFYTAEVYGKNTT
jgi:hypothetical protein